MIYLGMDVHKDSITVAVLPATAKAHTRMDRVPNDLRWGYACDVIARY